MKLVKQENSVQFNHTLLSLQSLLLNTSSQLNRRHLFSCNVNMMSSSKNREVFLAFTTARASSKTKTIRRADILCVLSTKATEGMNISY